ncbi:MAG: dienelactone hydrolase family protein [Rubrivivax sp.]
MGQTVSFERPDGQSLAGYLSEPASPLPGRPGLVVIQEWWGLNDQIRGVADRFAQAGYRALVPDLYRGRSTVEAEEASHLMNALDFADAAAQDVRGAVRFLQGGGSAKVGVTGYCMGGALTLLASMHVPEMAAGTVWYGFPPLEYVDATKIGVPLQAHWAERDVVFKIETVTELEQRFAAAGVAYSGHRYACEHAFANEIAVPGGNIVPGVTRYDEAAATLAWDRTLEFLGRSLGG